jgi:predicted TIM-barrel fold metal-dependent hydrolase
MVRAYKVISGDSHIDLSPDQWTHRIPTKWREYAPKVVTLPNGAEAVTMEGAKPRQISVLSHVGVPPAEIHKQIPTFANSAGCGSPEQRLQEQDLDGIDAEVLFTAIGNFGMIHHLKDDEGYLALLLAYNQYLAEEYMAVAPDRLIPLGQVPTCGIDAALAELEYCAQAGMKGVELERFPSGGPFPTTEDDRFWVEALAMNMPITNHAGNSGRMARSDEPTFDYKMVGNQLGLGERGHDPMRGWYFRLRRGYRSGPDGIRRGVGPFSRPSDLLERDPDRLASVEPRPARLEFRAVQVSGKGRLRAGFP